MNAFLEALGVWLADVLALATALLALSLVLRLVIRQPAARVALAWSTWLGLMAIAAISAAPAWPRYAIADMAVAWRPDETQAVEQPGANLLAEEPTPEVFLAEPSDLISHMEPMPVEAPAPPVVAAPAMLPLRSLAGGAWLATAALGVIWIVIGMARTRGLLVRAKEAPAWARDELRSVVTRSSTRERRRQPGLWGSERVDSAIALGAMQPQIVLPLRSLVPANRSAVRAALAHEWAHIRHGDLWLLALERLLLPLLAAHPLFWWLRRAVRLDQELLADAAAAGEQRVEYAEALLAWAKSARSARHGLAAIGMWESPSTLSRRVAMILDSNRPLASTASRGWAVALAMLLAPVVGGLSLITLRPLVAQEEEAVEAADPTAAPAAPHRERPAPSPRAATVPVTKIHLELLVMSVDREQLAAADTTLEDAIAAATESRCRREAGLVVSDITDEEAVKLVDGLKRHDALQVVSRPQIVTLDGREARLQVGGQVPILEIEESLNGKHERRVEYRDFGTMLVVRPKIHKAKDRVTLDILAEQASLLPPAEAADDGATPRKVPGLASHKFSLKSDVKFGDSLLVAESPADKKQGHDAAKKQFLLIISPKRAVREAAAVYADPAVGEMGERERQATEAALEAAAAAEPKPGTAAAALLAREREARRNETTELKRQIDALQKQLAQLLSRTEPKRGQTGNSAFDRDEAAEASRREVDVRLAELDLAQAKLAEEAAAKEFARIEQLRAANGVSQQELDARQIALAQAKIEVARAEAKLEAAKAAASQGTPTRPAASVADPQVSWGALRADVDEARLELQRAEQDWRRVEQLKAKGLIANNQVDQSQFDLEKARINLRRAEAKLHEDLAARNQPTAGSPQRSASSQIEIRLLELDVDEAKLALEDAEVRLAHAATQRVKSPSSLSGAEFQSCRVNVDRAKIQLQRAQIKLEAAKAAAATPER